MTKPVEGNQIAAYERAKGTLASQLDTEMSVWDFPTMLAELRKLIETKKKDILDSNLLRGFARKYLGLSGDRYHTLVAWLNRHAAMTDENIILVLHMMVRVRNGTFDHALVQKEKIQKSQIPSAKPEDMPRKAIDFSLTMLASLPGLLHAAGIKPEHVFDGDRMRAVESIQLIAQNLRLKIQFPESRKHDKPLSTGDMP